MLFDLFGCSFIFVFFFVFVQMKGYTEHCNASMNAKSLDAIIN